jgi:TolB-like protein/Tfp pilus assembly protein PilF
MRDVSDIGEAAVAVGRPDGAPGTGLPSASEVLIALNGVLASAPLRGSERLRRFLRFVVEETLAGQGGRLKEYVIGVEVLERPSSFDPRADPIVRVEARRLRAKLADYHGTEGRDDAVLIDLPKGSYVATFSRRAAVVQAAPPGGAAVPESGLPLPSSAAAPAVVVSATDPASTGIRHAIAVFATLAAVTAVAAAGYIALIRFREGPQAPPTVVVLPFANASADQANEYFCFGLVEDLTTALAQTPGLRVVARTSAMQFTGSQDVREIGRRLRVDYVVEGSVRKVGDRLRITTQIIDARDASHVWANAYDRGVRDLLATQAEIAQSVAVALGRQVAPSRASPQPMALDAESQELFLKGKYFVGVVGKQAPEKGLGYLRQVIERAPTYAPAHAAAAAAYAKITLDRPAPLPEEIALAKAEARRALEIDPTLADAHALLAWIAFSYDWNWPEAERGFLRALAINPNSATARHRYSLLLMSTGRFDEALAMSRKAIELDPLSAVVASNRAMILLCARRFDEAIAQARAALELAPGGFTTHVYVGSSYAQQGMLDRAIAAYRAALAAAPGDPDATASLGRALAMAGRRDEALAILADLQEPARPDPPSRYQVAFLLATLGDRSAAFVALEEARVRHETELVYLNVDPLFDQLRGDSRFGAFLDRLGLPH